MHSFIGAKISHFKWTKVLQRPYPAWLALCTFTCPSRSVKQMTKWRNEWMKTALVFRSAEHAQSGNAKKAGSKPWKCECKFSFSWSIWQPTNTHATSCQKALKMRVTTVWTRSDKDMAQDKPYITGGQYMYSTSFFVFNTHKREKSWFAVLPEWGWTPC